MFVGNKGLDELTAKLNTEGRKALCYAGFDPTGDALHFGHLGLLSLITRCGNFGHFTQAIIGTGTAFIGDPTGKNEMRKMMDQETIERNAEGIEEDIERVVPGISFVRNDWLKDINLQDFMREVGSRIPLNMLLNLTIVKNRLESGDGISLMETIYPILQGWDMVVIARRAKEMGVDTVVQLGGVDQTGNISMGIHLVNRLVDGVTAEGLVTPIITGSNGEKMGKTAGNALWINPDKTDNVLFFDTIRSFPDNVVPQMIDVFMPSLNKDADINRLKTALAFGITGWVRGDDVVEKIIQDKQNGGTDSLKEVIIMSSAPVAIEDIMMEAEFATSKSDARRLIKNKGVKINDAVLEEPALYDPPTEFILSKGKKNKAKIILKPE